MSPVRQVASHTFRSLRVRNFRFYFFGQIISVSGTWMQAVAQAWLVLHITGSPVALGGVTALQFLPLLLFGAFGGVIADRVNKRALLFVTQATAGILALVLGLLVATGAVRLWMIYLMAGMLGCVNVVDNPTRQSFVLEMVGPDNLTNAVSLNSVVMNSARIVGPTFAGVLISTVGLSLCFLINAGSYLAVIGALALMRRRELHEPTRVARAKGQLREGLRYVWSTPGLRIPLLMMVLIGTLAYEFQVSLAVLAKSTFHGGAGTYGAMFALMSAGAVVGGLFVAGRKRAPTTRTLVGAAVAFGVLILAVAASPVLGVAMAFLPPMGAASIAFVAMANSTLQLRSEPTMRGRVMALYAVAFLGSTPVGAPIIGWVAETAGGRAGLAVGGVAALVAGALAALALSRRRAAPVPAAPQGEASTSEAEVSAETAALEADVAFKAGSVPRKPDSTRAAS